MPIRYEATSAELDKAFRDALDAMPSVMNPKPVPVHFESNVTQVKKVQAGPYISPTCPTTTGNY